MKHATTILARIFGAIGLYFVAIANRWHPRWEPPPATHNYDGEADELLTIRNTGTIPKMPLRPQIDTDVDDLRPTLPCTPPPPMDLVPQSRRRVIMVDGQRHSVHSPVGTTWSQGGKA